ncbi:hypothetical protein [Idiomarina tyrosinivorans]|uniref:hypothetical protein n=1 Tax=Idiomarina tyrosinivorans TaxID=1445662 RepID=UPI000F884509|nr:hypothetical protein [Idiomarina tyrosinivorans]
MSKPLSTISFGNFVWGAFLIIALFFPYKKIELYFLTSSVFLLFSFMVVLPHLNKISLFPVVILFLVSISAAVGVFFEGGTVRNLSEIVRFIPLLLMFLTLPSLNVKTRNLVKILVFFSVANAGLTILQVLHVPYVDFITSIYASENHQKVSLGVSSRGLGFSQGPGQNGAIAAACLSIFLPYILNRDYVGKIPLLKTATTASLLSIILAQSQTAFLVSLGIIIYSLIYYFIKYPESRKKAAALGSLGMSFFFGFLWYMWDYLSYLVSLFTLGLERNSFQTRIEKSETILNSLFNEPYFFITGVGKDYFQYSSAMDNEYLFVWGVWGGFVLLIYIFIIFYFNLKIWNRRPKSNEHCSLAFLFCSGAVLAYPTSFLSDGRLMFLVTIFYFLSVKATKEINEKKNMDYQSIRFNS